MSDCFHNWICPVRPPSQHDEGGDEALEFKDSWDNIDDADVLRDPQSEVIGHADDDEEIAPDGSCIQVPVAAPEPPQPTKAEVERHNATHIHYRNWCPHCVYGRKPAAQHRSQPAFPSWYTSLTKSLQSRLQLKKPFVGLDAQAHLSRMKLCPSTAPWVHPPPTAAPKGRSRR